LSIVADVSNYRMYHPTGSHDCSDLIPLLLSQPVPETRLVVHTLDVNTFIIRTEPRTAFSIGNANLLGMALVLRKKLI